MSSVKESLITELNHLNLMIHRLCNQVQLISDQIRQLQIRQKNAIDNNQSTFRYLLRLRIINYESVRQAILQRASCHSKRMDQIERILRQR